MNADQHLVEDGTVMMLRALGYTPGAQQLLVRLKALGPVILSGDTVHCHESDEHDGVPAFPSAAK